MKYSPGHLIQVNVRDTDVSRSVLIYVRYACHWVCSVIVSDVQACLFYFRILLQEQSFTLNFTRNPNYKKMIIIFITKNGFSTEKGSIN